MTDEELIRHIIEDHQAEPNLSLPTEVLRENHALMHSVFFTLEIAEEEPSVWCDHTHPDIEVSLLNVKFNYGEDNDDD